MNALLVNPWITDFKLYDEWMHPVGLYLLGSLLIQNSWQVEYINCLERTHDEKQKRYNTGKFQSEIIETPQIFKGIDRYYRIYGISEEIFLQKLNSIEKPDMIFITSGMTYWIDGLKKCINLLKQKFPNIPIIIGGISAQLIPEKLKEYFPNAHIFSKQILNKGTIKISDNLVLNSPSKPLSLIPFLLTIPQMIHGPILTTLGCPYSCKYCASKIIQKDFYVRPVDTITSELEFMSSEYNISDFSFYDDALLFKPNNNFIPLGTKILKVNKSFRFHAPNGLHIKWINKDVATLMKDMGFKTLRFGYESGNRKYKDYTGYKTEQEEIKQKVDIILKTGFPAKDVGIYVMGGLPEQTPDMMYDDIEFIHSLGVKAKPVFISPVPQTSIYNFYKSEYPEIIDDPRMQNDIFFITMVKGWGYKKVNEIRERILQLNRTTEKY